jgi:hypothetical protein
MVGTPPEASRVPEEEFTIPTMTMIMIRAMVIRTMTMMRPVTVVGRRS